MKLPITIFLLLCGNLALAAAPRGKCKPPHGSVVNKVQVKDVFPEMGFEKPVQAVLLPGTTDWLIVSQKGTVNRVSNGTLHPFMDIESRVALGQQTGLQAISFHPKFPSDNRLFVAYIAKKKRGEKADYISRVSHFRVNLAQGTVDADTERILIAESQGNPWHPLNEVKFGPDGLLYIAFGDGAGHERMGGSLVRIDVDGPDPKRGTLYRIPPSNPFVNVKGVLPEVFARGFRNPWRFSFDTSGRIWLSDVGARDFEEINQIHAGLNYGFPYWEGNHCVKQGCKRAGIEFPFHQHSRNEMCAIIGGYVYRGKAIPSLQGKYVYSDYCTGRIWALSLDVVPPRSELIFSGLPDGSKVGSIAEDSQGELLLLESSDWGPKRLHKLRKILPMPASAVAQTGGNFGLRLSETGCLSPQGFKEPPAAMIPYQLKHSAWADKAETIRFVTSEGFDPIHGNQTKLLLAQKPATFIKTYTVEGKPVETQILMKDVVGRWSGFDYRWQKDGKDAVLVTEATSQKLPDGTFWHFPGTEGCFNCHNSDGTLGFTIPLLDIAVDHEGEKISQLELWRRIGVIPAIGAGKLEKIGDNAIHRDSLVRESRNYLGINRWVRGKFDATRSIPLIRKIQPDHERQAV